MNRQGPPAKRSAHTCSIVPARFANVRTGEAEVLVVYGGFNGHTVLGDLHTLPLAQNDDGLMSSWRTWDAAGVPPAPRALHSTSLLGDSLFVFGGWSGHSNGARNLLADLWELAMKADEPPCWHPVALSAQADQPCARQG